jgi:SagB-type dehydrogenase family enzyme
MKLHPSVTEFMRVSSPDNPMHQSEEMKQLPKPPLELPVPDSAHRIALPKPDELHIPPVDLRTALENRQSVRKYSDQPLSLQELAFLLWVTQGIKSLDERPSFRRNVPSAGGRHAFETYLLINKVQGVEPGLYRYVASEHCLIEIDLSPELPEALVHACQDQSKIKYSAVSFFWAAVPFRMTWRFSERGYRYLFLDAGHVCQNLYLAAEAIDCGVCAVAAYNDALVNAALKLDGETQFIIYVATLGKQVKE